MQVHSATVESGNRYSVTELAQHQQCTAVMPTPYMMPLFLCQGRDKSGWARLWSVLGQAGPGGTLAPAKQAFFGACTSVVTCDRKSNCLTIRPYATVPQLIGECVTLKVAVSTL